MVNPGLESSSSMYTCQALDFCVFHTQQIAPIDQSSALRRWHPTIWKSSRSGAKNCESLEGQFTFL